MIEESERDSIEESLYDTHFAATKFLETGKDIHFKLLEVSVSEALDYFELLKRELEDDEFLDNYRLHLFVPLQLMKLMEMRDDRKE